MTDTDDDFAGRTWWIVGASEGLGRALAERLSRAGATLILSARSEDRLHDLARSLPGPARALPLDVRDRAGVEAAARTLPQIDGVIWLAGVYWPMAAGEWNTGQAEAMADINFTGALRVLGTVVPGFVARDRGHVVLIGSLSGFRGLPGAIGYGAAKAGVMHLAENLRADLHGSGVKVQLVNPGYIRTRLTEKNDFAMPFIVDPDTAADKVVAAMRTGRFQTNFPRLFSWLFRGSLFLPAALYYRLFGAG
jgi:NADP-dependent 3-hydroxy acid dehydrogenase YdfG